MIDKENFHRMSIWGLFHLTIEFPVSSVQPQPRCDYTILEIEVSDSIPRFVGDEVFPDWLGYEDHGITGEEFGNFMSQY